MIALDVNRTIGAAGQRLAQHLGHARRSGADDEHLTAVLLAQAQRLFERVGVGLVQLPARVSVADPGLRLVDADLPFAGDDLLDADGNSHGSA